MRVVTRCTGMLLLLFLGWSTAPLAADAADRQAPKSFSGLSGVHRMPATVVDFDKETGIVDLKTDVGELKVHFPPAALTGLKKGDAVQLQLGFRKTKANE